MTRGRRDYVLGVLKFFLPGHRCIRSQLYHLLVDNSNSIRGELEEFLDCVDNIEGSGTLEDEVTTISLHALLCTEGCQTMRILGKIQRQPLIMLVDSRSTHNFIDAIVTKKLRCHTTSISGVNVNVANGDTLIAHEVCELVSWESQGLTQLTNFFILPFMSCDFVLGV